MKNKRIILTIVIILSIIIAIIFNNLNQKQETQDIEIKTNKDSIYNLFNNFPESKNIYFTSNNLYGDRSIGPSIYQIDILAELTDDAYDNFINQVEFADALDFKTKINPRNLKYAWKNIKNIDIIESKDIEDASITHIYLDESTKTIYIIALGGN